MESLLGLHVPSAHLEFHQMAARALVVFLFGLVLVRCGDRRLLGGQADFDVLLWVILGSVLSRGVNGQAAFFPTLGASAVIVLLHHLLSAACFRWHRISILAKGQIRTLVRNGQVVREEVRRNHITADDLDQGLRINGGCRVEEVAEARLERNGQISVLKK